MVWLGEADAYEVDAPPSTRRSTSTRSSSRATTPPAAGERGRRRRRRAEHPHPCELGSPATHHDTEHHRRPQGRDRPPHRVGQLVHGRPGAPDAAVGAGVPPGRPGLHRHRLQLRRRPLRAHLGGARRRHHQRRARGAQPGLQHGHGGRRRPRRLPHRRGHALDVRVDGAGDRVEARAPSGRSPLHGALHERRLGQVPGRHHRHAAPGRRPRRRPGHELPGDEPDHAASPPCGRVSRRWCRATKPAWVPCWSAPTSTGDQLTDPFEYRPGGGADVQWRASAVRRVRQGGHSRLRGLPTGDR